MKAIVMNGTGGREMLEYVERPDPVAGPGQALVEIAFAGVNFMDIGVRQGMAWNEMHNPKILGVEGAGRVVAAGDGVESLAPGQRVAWVYAPGSYAERIAIPATSLVPVPDTIDDRTAASVMMQGLTASHFATDFYPVQPGDIAFVHAAAGGVGLLLTQIVKLRGGHVIGRVSSEEKIAMVEEAGADHVIVDSEGRFAEEALRLTCGEGVHVVYDGSGPKTFQGSLEVLRRSGTFCWYGPVLGGPGPLDIMSLPRSIKIGYATFFDHIHTPELLRAHGAAVRLDCGREAQDPDWRRVSAGGCGAGPCRHGEPQDHRQAGACPVSARVASRVAIVFGGSRGIGAAIASRLARDGFDVALTYVSRPDRASDLVSAIEDIGRRAIAVRADSADPAAIRNAVAETVERLGTLDVAVVNAGVLRLASVEAFTLEDLDLMLDVNVRGVFLAIQASVARMHDGGRVVTIGSNTAVRTGSQGSSAYAMTKAAVATMVKGIALDLAPRQITVNNVQPGPTETDMTTAMVARLREVIPVGRMGRPDEIAALVSYLAGPESAYMTGASLTIDGGYVL
jgi:NADPH2:quinone reductase